MKKLVVLLAAVLVAGAAPLLPARAQVPDGEVTDLPVLSRETPRGSGITRPAAGRAPVAKTVDGDISDWVGSSSRYGGTAVYSAGELIYQDHLFDAHGADDGRDAQRFERTDGLEAIAPELYRLDALAQADAPGELGLPAPEQFSYGESYGDVTEHQDRSDLEEVRVAIDDDTLSVLARTTTMTSPDDTAVLVLADTVPGESLREIPFNSGIASSVADVAVFVTDGNVRIANLETGAVTTSGSAVAAPAGWTNAIEAAVPLAELSALDGSIALAVASGSPNQNRDGFAPLTLETNDAMPHANLANVAFRFGEAVRIWFDKEQALALHSGTIDPFFMSVDAAAMRSGASETYTPGPGYHDRIFVSAPSTGVPQESGRNGIFQHYGVYLPESYSGEPVPLQWWLHWRGGNAHTGAAVVPKVFKQFGEDRDSIVVSPSGRGTSTWYVGRGHVDFRQVWADVSDAFAIDRERVYVTGHSMGGWGSYLLTLLYPDRFAAAAPVAGPVTQGAWTGLDFPGCDEMQWEENTPCYISANDGRPRDQHTRKILENARYVPYAILHGTSDELVPYSGVFRQAERLVDLGYRHRLYTYPGYEHYSHPAADQWAEAAQYLHRFARPADPARVTYIRSMPFETATEEVQSGGATLNFNFDSAYWMSELTPVDAARGIASFDGTSLAIAEEPYAVAPDAGPPTAPGQTGPYVITGLQWVHDPTTSTPEAANAFHATLEGASGVRLDLARMRIDVAQPVSGSITTGAPLALRLSGAWTAPPSVTIDGEAAGSKLSEGVVTVTVPTGTHEVVVTPSDEPEPPRESALSLVVAGKGSKRTLTATLTDAHTGAALAGRTIVFTADGTEIGSEVTDGTGVARLDAPPGYRGGDITFTAIFGGAEDYSGATASQRV